jgi:3-deoxy-D-manno-octulosonic-acid transferase
MFLYSIGIKIYVLAIYLVSFFNLKARKIIQGRKGFFDLNQPEKDHAYIWFHCASLGEFEQGRPIIEKIKKEFPAKKILLSFFSPSGYEIRKNYEFADKVIYLPFDSSSNAKRFIQTFHIEMAIFVKYDVWPFYLRELLKQQIPVFLTSAVFRKNHVFFKWYGAFLKKLMFGINKIFVQDADSKNMAETNGLTNVEIAGDARIDRVLQIKESIGEVSGVKSFLNGSACIAFGSVYQSDVKLIEYLTTHASKEYKWMIVPHQVDENSIKYFKQVFPEAILFSRLQEEYSGQHILIVDHVGSLNKLYQYAKMAYIGGGFEANIHNILEPAVFNIPVFFGPAFGKFPEASSLINEGLAFSDPNPVNLAKIMTSQLEQQASPGFKQRSNDWFSKKSGATDLIFSELRSYF